MDIFKLRYYQAQNFEIWNNFERDQNFVVNFQKDWKRNRKLIKYIKVEQNLSNMPKYTVKFWEISGNFANFIKLL